jgi:hypothetical protein
MTGARFAARRAPRPKGAAGFLVWGALTLRQRCEGAQRRAHTTSHATPLRGCLWAFGFLADGASRLDPLRDAVVGFPDPP